METKFFEEYERELVVGNILVTNDKLCACYFNNYREIAVYGYHLAVLELKLMNELIGIFPCGVISSGYRRMLEPQLLVIKRLFHEEDDGTVTRSDLIFRSGSGERVVLSRTQQKCVSAYVQVQWESLSRILVFIGEDDRFLNFPYFFTGKISELIHYCEALYTCQKVVGVSGEMDLRQFIESVFHLLHRKVPGRIDLLLERIFTSKNRMLHFDKFRKKYRDEILKGN